MLKLCQHPYILKGGFSLYMKPNSTRCLTYLLILCLFLSTFTPLKVEATTELSVAGEPWCQTMIFPEEDFVHPNTVIIYIHGAGETGRTVEDLERFARANHPLKYSREGTLEMPDDCMLICLQAKNEGEFSKKSNELCDMIHALSESQPDTKIILVGHSSGAMATYEIASTGNSDIDGYVFISGMQTDKCQKLPLIPNCLVVFGYEEMVAYRTDFSNLFYGIDISDKKYRDEISYVEEITNNAYFVSKKWNHGSAPQVFLEDFFWEWVNNVTPLTEESN